MSVACALFSALVMIWAARLVSCLSVHTVVTTVFDQWTSVEEQRVPAIVDLINFTFDVAELAAREMEKHVQESQVDHLCMVVRRVKEMQVVLGKHQGSLNALDATAKDQQRQITGLAAGAATAPNR